MNDNNLTSAADFQQEDLEKLIELSEQQLVSAEEFIPDAPPGVIPDEYFRLSKDGTYYIVGDNRSNEMLYHLSGDIAIPSEFNGLPVKEIGDLAFDSSDITSVVIPDSVITIGNDAFYNCQSLTSVTIGNSVTKIGYYAFSYCTSLTSINIPDSVTEIGSYAFSGCSYLININIGNYSEYLDHWSFDKTRLSKIIVSETNQRYEFVDDCLIDKTANTLIIALKTCKKIPNSVTEIGDYAFRDCSSLTNVVIPDSVTIINNNAFRDCSSLTSVIIPNSVTTIGDNAFRDCSALTSINIPDSVTTIGTSAFYKCSALKAFIVNKEIVNLSSQALGNTSQLTHVLFTENSGYTTSSKFAGKSMKLHTGLVFTLSSDGTYYIVGNPNNRLGMGCYGHVVIPETYNGLPVKEIAAYAFYQDPVTRVDIPNSVEKIGAYAFYECKRLAGMILPTNPNYTTIEDSCFRGALFGGIYIPKNVTTIKQMAFRYNTSLNCVKIPESVTTIEANAFQYCTGLRTFGFEGKPTAIDSTIFANCSSAFTTVKFKKGSGWTTSDKVGGKTMIEYDPFLYELNSDGVSYGIKQKTAADCFGYIDIPSTYNNLPVTRIIKAGFKNNTSIQFLYIPDSIKLIEAEAFYNTYYIRKLNIGDGVEKIDTNAFAYCYNSMFTHLHIPASVKTISESAFGYNYALEKITVDPANTVFTSRDSEGNECNGIIKISTNDFWYGCKNSVIPEGITKVYTYAFRGCNKLTEFKIPSTCVAINPSAYIACSSLTSVYIPKQVQVGKLSTYAFNNCVNIIKMEVDPENTTLFSDQNCIIRKNYKTKDSFLKKEHLNSWLHSCCKGSIIPDYITIMGAYSAYCLYSAAPLWKLPKTLEIIESYAFYACNGYTKSIKIPDSVKVIGAAAFMYCSGTPEIILSNNSEYDYIRDSTFRYCSKAKNFYIPHNIKRVGKTAFANNAELEKIIIGNNVETIESKAFDTNVKLKEVVWKSNKCTSISSDAFNGDTELTSIKTISNVKIPENIVLTREKMHSGLLFM